MKTKHDFQQAIADAIADYPVAAQLYQARDPRLLAQLDAMAAMLGMLSGEMDVQSMESFTKARDVTVLADASVKGILPFGDATLAKIKVENASAAAFPVATGRRIQDTQGRAYVVTTGATIPAGDFDFVEASQQSESSFTHVVSASQPFYQIPIPTRAAGKYVTEIRVRNTLYDFTYTAEFVNVDIGDRVFHLESDETRALFVQFGASAIAGYQPSVGEEFTVTVIETEGAIELAAGSQFAFEYSASLFENGATLTLDSILSPGAAAMDVATMREVTNYPSIYDGSAVYLGNFDFLIRRHLSPLEFLSVWNEQTEESVRGANIDNINRLFVAAQKDGVSTPTLRAQIADIINEADDSYRITHVNIIEEEVALAITAYVPTIYDFASVSQQIREIALGEYGQESVWSKRGKAKIKYTRLYDLLENGIQALQAAGSDIRISVSYPGNDDGEARTALAYTRASTTVTVAFVAHGFVIGDAIQVTSATDSAIDGQVVITAKTADTFSFETTAVGADGTLTLVAYPRPEKWRFVSEASLTITVLQAT